MKFPCLKPFKLSTDGVNFAQIEAGDEPDIPEAMIEGLIKEGFILDPNARIDDFRSGPLEPLTSLEFPALETKPAGQNLETKTGEVEPAVEPAPEPEVVPAAAPASEPDDTPEIESLRAQYLEATGNDANKRWSVATLRDKLIEA